MIVGDAALGSLVMLGFALAMSRRHLTIAFILCVAGLALLGVGFYGWVQR